MYFEACEPREYCGLVFQGGAAFRVVRYPVQPCEPVHLLAGLRPLHRPLRLDRPLPPRTRPPQVRPRAQIRPHLDSDAEGELSMLLFCHYFTTAPNCFKLYSQTLKEDLR